MAKAFRSSSQLIFYTITQAEVTMFERVVQFHTHSDKCNDQHYLLQFCEEASQAFIVVR